MTDTKIDLPRNGDDRIKRWLWADLVSKTITVLGVALLGSAVWLFQQVYQLSRENADYVSSLKRAVVVLEDRTKEGMRQSATLKEEVIKLMEAVAKQSAAGYSAAEAGRDFAQIREDLSRLREYVDSGEIKSLRSGFDKLETRIQKLEQRGK